MNSVGMGIWLVVVVQLLSHGRLFGTPWNVAYQSSLSSFVFHSQSLLKFMFTESMMLSGEVYYFSKIFNASQSTMYRPDAVEIFVELKSNSISVFMS